MDNEGLKVINSNAYVFVDYVSLMCEHERKKPSRKRIKRKPAIQAVM